MRKKKSACFARNDGGVGTSMSELSSDPKGISRRCGRVTGQMFQRRS